MKFMLKSTRGAFPLKNLVEHVLQNNYLNQFDFTDLFRFLSSIYASSIWSFSAKTVKHEKLLTIFAKESIIDV